MPDTVSADVLRSRLIDLVRSRPRTILGIAGAPGSGKTTLARELVEYANGRALPSVWVPMDGFHLADVELDRLGLLDRKGAIETFDAWGYAALLARIRTETEHIVYAPGFERTLNQPIAGSIPVPPETRLVITEGNYLLADVPPWPTVLTQLDEIWFCDAAASIRAERLVARHVRFGMTPSEAREWVAAVDTPNARFVQQTRGRADLVVSTEKVDR